MWKLTFPNPSGGQPSIYWVAADSPTAAETVARQQAGSRIAVDAPAGVAHADAVDGEVWRRPRLVDGIRVFTFDDSRQAYDQTQVGDDIHDGDVLRIPRETVAGFLLQAWPVAISPNTGALHPLTDPGNPVVDGVDYSASVQVARTLLCATQPPPVPTSRGLRYAADVWTVTIADSGRYDGGGISVWVVNAADATIAAATAERRHRITHDDTDTGVRHVDPGAPTADYPWAYTDLRGIPSKTIVLTPPTFGGSLVSGWPTSASTAPTAASTAGNPSPSVDPGASTPCTATSPPCSANSSTTSATAPERHQPPSSHHPLPSGLPLPRRSPKQQTRQFG